MSTRDPNGPEEDLLLAEYFRIATDALDKLDVLPHERDAESRKLETTTAVTAAATATATAAAATAAAAATTERTTTLGGIRALLLRVQTDCLQTAIDTCFPPSPSSSSTNSTATFAGRTAWTPDALRHALARCGAATISDSRALGGAMERTNDAARLAFCRLVLYAECRFDDEINDNHGHNNSSNKGTSKSGGSGRSDLIAAGGAKMKRADVLEFCGLCQAAVRLPAVTEHLRRGTPLCEAVSGANGAAAATTTAAAMFFPQQRLERIQRQFLRALGYDPDYGTCEIKRLCYNADGCSADHQHFHETFRSMARNMEAVLAEATAGATHDAFFPASDNDDDGDNVTRVVSVSYSEKLIDAVTGAEIFTFDDDDAAPRSETMDGQPPAAVRDADCVERQQRQRQRRQSQADLQLARRAGVLRQEILGELLSLRDEARDAKLRQARAAVDAVARAAALRPPGPERVAYLVNLDTATQRLMATLKVWDDLLAAHGGQPPTLR